MMAGTTAFLRLPRICYTPVKQDGLREMPHAPGPAYSIVFLLVP